MILVDSNIIIDIITGNPDFCDESASLLARLGTKNQLAINPIVYGEISAGFSRIEEVDAALPQETFFRLELPWQACFLAGQAYQVYRKRSGRKTSPIADFYIGAHAAVLGIPLVTRDKARYQSYFSKVKLYSPEH